MGKISVSILAALALIFTFSTVISAYRHLQCNADKEGNIFVRSVSSIYMCKDRHEEHIGCIYSKSASTDDLYGFDTKFLYAQINDTETAHLFNVGKRNLPNCCAMRDEETGTEHLRQYIGAQNTLGNILRIAKGLEKDYDVVKHTSQKLEPENDLVVPYNSICKMSTDVNKKIYVVQRSALFKCVGDNFVQQTNVCAIQTNSTSAIRCATTADIKTQYGTELDAFTGAEDDFCCQVHDTYTNLEEVLKEKLKPCNVVA